MVVWEENGHCCQARWLSSHGWAAPRRLVTGDDALSADQAMRLVSGGTAIVWRGDFHNGRQLLESLKRRLQKRVPSLCNEPYPARFHRVRLARAQTARLLGLILLPMETDYRLGHRRAPDVRAACEAAHGAASAPVLMPMTELMGALSAHQWQTRGLWVDALQATIYPRHGVFAPTRHEYLALVANAPLPTPCERALDVGTGTGVLAALLARRGVGHVLATDVNPRALACAQDTITALAMAGQVDLRLADLFVDGLFDLVVCNPPWLPGRASSALEAAIYDPDGQMLKRFLTGVAAHLSPAGQAWLVLSDLAERLGLRTREQLLDLIKAAGLQLLAKDDIAPRHRTQPRAQDPLADARSGEITSLWRLTLAETR